MAELQGRRRFAHLFRRAGFGPNEAELNAAMALNPDENTAFNLAVDSLLNYQNVPEVADRFSPTDPSVTPDLVVESSTILWWLDRMVRTRRPLLEKMTLFWHDHFATSGEKEGIIPRMASQNELLRQNALGNFENMLRAISRDPSMMLWQDIVSNKKGNPNENFARELMELFSIGIGQPNSPNYSEADIKEATRAFTGYTIGTDGNWALNSAQHDSGTKTVLGQTLPANQGKKDGDDVLEILARHPSTARFISTKLCRRFVSDTPGESVIARGADAFTRSEGDIAEVMRAIIGTPDFWNEAFGPGKIKTPHEYVVSALRAVAAEVSSARSFVEGGRSTLTAMGMPTYEALDPTGWSDRGSDWLPNPGSHLNRMNFALRLVSQTLEGVSVDLRALIGDTDAADAAAVTAVVDRRIFGGTLSPDVAAACRAVTRTGSLLPGFKAVGMALASPAFQVR